MKSILLLGLGAFALQAFATCPPLDPQGPKIVSPSNAFNAFYTKTIDKPGLQIVASSSTCDRTLQVAYEIAHEMLSKRPDIESRLIAQKAFIAIFSVTEKLTDLPEDHDLAGKPTGGDPSLTFDDLCGGGGVPGRPTAICEKNLIGVNDPYYGRMSVLVHEFGHAMQNLGIDAATAAKVQVAYQNATAANLFPATRGSGVSWMMSNQNEFFAEGTGTWFNAADPKNPANSPEETGRANLKTYDPELYQILANIYPDDNWVYPRK